MQYRLRKTYSNDPEKALKEILIDRGVKEIDKFLNPSAGCELNPYDLENIEAGANMLIKHMKAKNSVLFVVDADCDGFTSSAILWLYIKEVWPDANLEFIVHEHKQHGLNDVIFTIEDNPRYDLVICPDSASYDVKEHGILEQLGIDCLVLDHHEQLYGDDGLPVISHAKNTIIINNQLSPDYSNKSLCGAGVTYKFCEVLDVLLGVQHSYKFRDLVALGEIADVMDKTTSETNYLINIGLQNITNKGFKTLLEAQAYSLKEKAIYPYPNLNSIDIAFYIAPLINAITRVGTISEKETMFYCFIEPDRLVQSTKRGAKLGETETAAEQTARVGKNAKARQDKAKERAIEIVDFKIQKNDLLRNNIIFVELDDSDNIPQELTGLIAMNIVSKYHKPVMIGRRNSRDEVQGSARSDNNFSGLPSFKRFLEDSGLVMYAAGHDAAFGQGILGKKIEALMDYANEKLNPADFENCYTVDYILDAQDNNYDLMYSLGSHPEYFGNHIDEVTLVIKNIPLTDIFVMGTNKDSIRISYNNIDYVRFKDLDFIQEVLADRTQLLNVYGKINLNTYMGRTSVQVFCNDYELVEDNSKYDF